METMKEAYNLVVSFAEGDNVASETSNGWVTDFCKFLGLFSNRLSKHNLKVHLMKDLKGGSLPNNSICIPVLSPTYLQSQDCKEELKKMTEKSIALFRVQRHPVSNRDLPEKLITEIAYKFYERSIESDSGYLEYYSTNMNRKYWLKMVDLAYDIMQMISRDSQETSTGAGAIVYLAETTFDQEGNRDTLRRELQRFGHKILPDHPLPEDSTKLKTEIENYLDQCSIAIHMVGAHYGKNVNGTEMSMVEYQNKTAGDFAEKKNKGTADHLKRYLWSPPNVKAADEKQMLYLDRLKEEINRSSDAEIIQVPLENLKTIVEKNLDHLRVNNLKSSEMDSNEVGKCIVYLIFDKNDEKDIEKLKDSIEKSNCEVRTPEFTGNQLDLLHKHRDNLVEADAVFIYSKTSNQHWLNSKVNDLIKSPGFGRRKSFKAQALCVSNEKVNTGTYKEFGDILAYDKLNEETINSFLQKLK